MTTEDRLNLLRRKVDVSSQSQVAREIGYSTAAVSQVLSGNYRGNADHLLAKVEEVYGTTTVKCPGLGQEISLATCAGWRKKGTEFAATNPQRVRMYRACKNCPHNPKSGGNHER